MIKLENIVRQSIIKLKPYSSARDEFKGIDGIFLDANENPYGIYNRYPDPYQSILKSKIAEIKNTNPENLFIGNGSDEIIDLTYRIFCNPGSDKALTFSPTYGMYEVSAAINDTKFIQLPLNDEFQLDLNVLKPHLSDSNLKLIFICSPNNPTGNLMNKKDIEWILQNFHGIVVIDEAYFDFADEDSCASLLNYYNNLIVIQTLSKAWGLASIRIGIAITSKEIVSFFNKVKPPYNVSSLNQKFAVDSLSNKKNYEENLILIKSEKLRLIQELKKLDKIQKIFHSDANFILIKVKNANETYQSLVERKIIIRNRSGQIENCLRITIGTKEENDQLLNALNEIL